MTDSDRPVGPPQMVPPEDIVRSPRELELDVLVAHELASGSPTARLIWDAVGWSVPQAVSVKLQARRGDGRTTDVEAKADDGRRLLCEDKLAGGALQDGQIESYRGEVESGHGIVRAVLIAPKAFSGQGSHHGYAEQAAEISDGRVELTPDALVFRGSFVRFVPGRPAPPGFDLLHKMDEGALDVRVPRWKLSVLEAYLDTLPEQSSLPDGWKPARPRNARRDEHTGEPTPVLRLYVGRVEGRIEKCTMGEAKQLGRAAADLAVPHADSIGRWLQTVGAYHLRPATPEKLRAELGAALATATRLGWSDVVSTIAELVSRAGR